MIVQPPAPKKKGSLLVIFIIALLAAVAIAVVVYIASKSKDPGDEPTKDCVDQIKKICNMSDSNVTCDGYYTCLQTVAYAENVVSGCKSDWLNEHCIGFVPGPGTGVITGSTYAWTGPYFKIVALGTGPRSALNIDLSVINKVVLNIDFSYKYMNNNTDTEVTFSINGSNVKSLVSEYTSIRVIPPDNIKIATPTPSPGVTILGDVELGDSTVNENYVNLTFNTDTHLKTSETFTLLFIR
jgi:hypothetical protein